MFSDPFSTQEFSVFINDEQQGQVKAFKRQTVTWEGSYQLTEEPLSVKIIADEFALDPVKPRCSGIIIRSDYDVSDESLQIYQQMINDCLAKNNITEDSNAALNEALEKIEEAAACEGDERIELVADIHTALKEVEESMNYEEFRPGEVWLDTNNRQFRHTVVRCRNDISGS